MSDALTPNYARMPLAFERGEGVFLWCEEGHQYLDALSGIAVTSLGHAHPQVVAALTAQAQRVIHTSNLYEIPLQRQLAQRLAQLSGLDLAFFCNSGAEANEAALKLARLYGHEKGIQEPHVIVMDGSFHGRTLATLSASGNRKIQAGFEPLVTGFVRAPFNDLMALETILESRKDIVAIFVEPLLGEGGIVAPAADYLQKVRQLCDQYGCLMMLDEIQTGIGRSGRWFAFQHTAVKPDVITLAKALGNGVPIGAVVATRAVGALFQAGKHGSTFGGNPLVCATALTVLKVIEDEKLVENAEQQGAFMLRAFQERLAHLPQVIDIRGKGLLLGIELDQVYPALKTIFLEQRVLVNITADKVIRLLPPLIINQQQAQMIVDRVVTSIELALRA